MILVTGGTGFLGSHLIKQLVDQGETVRALKRDSGRGNVYAAPKILEKIVDQVEWVKGDVLDIPSLEDAMKGITYVYHCAAVVSFDPKFRKSMMKVNVEGTANVVNVAIDSKIKKMLHVSSIASLGRTKNGGIINENTQWEDSKYNSNYAISKFLGEREIWRGIAEGLDAVIVNPAVILGEGNWCTDSSAFFRTVWKGLAYYPQGSSGFVDVEDVARAMILLMESDVKNERFILSAENRFFKKLFEEIASNFSITLPYRPVSSFLGELAWRVEMIRSNIIKKPPRITRETFRISSKEYYYNNRKIKKQLNFEFKPLKVTIKETCERFIK